MAGPHATGDDLSSVIEAPAGETTAAFFHIVLPNPPVAARFQRAGRWHVGNVPPQGGPPTHRIPRALPADRAELMGILASLLSAAFSSAKDVVSKRLAHRL